MVGDVSHPYRAPGERPSYPRYVTDEELRDATRLIHEQEMERFGVPLAVVPWWLHVVRWIVLG